MSNTLHEKYSGTYSTTSFFLYSNPPLSNVLLSVSGTIKNYERIYLIIESTNCFPGFGFKKTESEINRYFLILQLYAALYSCYFKTSLHSLMNAFITVLCINHTRKYADYQINMQIKTTRSAGSLFSPIRACYSLEPQGSLKSPPTAYIHMPLLKQLSHSIYLFF